MNIKQILNNEVVQGQLRHLLTIVGGLLIAKGIATHDQVTSISTALSSPELLGAAVAIVGVVQSALHKQTKAPVTPVTPPVTPSTVTPAKEG